MQDQVTQRERLSSRDRALATRSRRTSASASSSVHGLRLLGGARLRGLCGCGNNASNSGRRSCSERSSAGTTSPTCTHVARSAAANSSASARHPSCASIVRVGQEAKTHQRVMQLVGVLRASGHTSSRTRAIAATSSRPRSAAVSGSRKRRAITALCGALSSGANRRDTHMPRRENSPAPAATAREIAPTTSTRRARSRPAGAPGHRCPSPRAGIVDRLSHQWMIGNLAVADDVLAQATCREKWSPSGLRRACAALRRHLAAALKRSNARATTAFQRQALWELRAASSACTSSGRTLPRSSNARRQAAETVRRRDRGTIASSVAAACQLEIETMRRKRLRRPAPIAIEPVPNGECTTNCMPPVRQKNPFEHDALDRRQGCPTPPCRCVVIDHLFRGIGRRRGDAGQPREGAGTAVRRRAVGDWSRAAARRLESSWVRPGASPSQNGTFGVSPSGVFDAHRTAFDSQLIRYDWLPSWNTSLPSKPLDVLAQQIVAEVGRASGTRTNCRAIRAGDAVQHADARRVHRKSCACSRTGFRKPARPSRRPPAPRRRQCVLRGPGAAALAAVTSGGTF